MPDLLLALPAGIALGIVLGLLGGGGGLIAVPLFGAIFGWSIDDSGTASMACMLTGSAAALWGFRHRNRVRVRVGVTYGLLGIVGAVVGSLAAFAVPNTVQHVGLAGLLIASGTLMLRKARRLRRPTDAVSPARHDHTRVRPAVALVATGIGAVVGLFGISGGFLTVPALVTVAGLAVPQATATALIVVMINATTALTARAGHVTHLGTVALLAVATGLGALLGARFSRRASAFGLALGFGTLMLLIAAWELHMAIGGA